MKKLRKVILIILIYIGLIFINTNVFASTGTTIESTTRLRKEASTESAIVTLIPENAKVEIISKDGEWYKVTYTENSKKLTGFIRQDMLKAEGDVEAEVEVNNDNTIEETNNSETNTAETEKEEEEEEEEEEECLIKEGDSYNIKNNITVRILPSINSTLLEEAGANSQIKVVEIINKWCKIETETTSGWVLLIKIEKVDTNTVVEEHIEEVKEEKIEENKEEVKEEQKDETKTETKTKTLFVNTDTVNMREKADTNSKILRQLSLNTTVEVLEKVNDTWSKVSKSGVTGYIASKYLSETKTEVTSRAMQESRTTDETEVNNTKTTEITENASKIETPNIKASTKGEEIVNFAKQYLGYKYVAGGASPSAGFDCSGFTSYVYKHFGYSLSRTASGQRSNGKEVSSKSELQLGDIVCFTGHVGIYIGGNQFIHAANPKKGVVITPLSDSYYTTNYITSRRIIN